MVGDTAGVTITAPHGAYFVPWAQVQTAKLGDVVTEPKKAGKHGR